MSLEEQIGLNFPHENQNEESVKATLKAYAVMWVESSNNTERVECDKKADEYIDCVCEGQKNRSLIKLSFATFYVNEKLRLRREARKEKESQETKKAKSKRLTPDYTYVQRSTYL